MRLAKAHEPNGVRHSVQGTLPQEMIRDCGSGDRQKQYSHPLCLSSDLISPRIKNASLLRRSCDASLPLSPTHSPYLEGRIRWLYLYRRRIHLDHLADLQTTIYREQCSCAKARPERKAMLPNPILSQQGTEETCHVSSLRGTINPTVSMGKLQEAWPLRFASFTNLGDGLTMLY